MGKPRSLRLTLETVTPLFLGGADPRGQPELRAPPFRGAMRYWLRAALGGVIGDGDLSRLHALEQAVFGSTQHGSPVVVRVKEGAQALRSCATLILPHKQSGSRNAFASGQIFELSLHQLRSNDDLVWDAACASLALMLTFGGVGLRARRGYGTLRLRDGQLGLVTKWPASMEEWKTHVKDVASQAIRACRALASADGKPIVGLPDRAAAYPCATRTGLIKLCDLVPRHKDAMDAVKELMGKVGTVRKNGPLGGISPRQASPLWVRPIQIGGCYGLLLSVLDSRFPGSNMEEVKRFLRTFGGEDVKLKGWNA